MRNRNAVRLFALALAAALAVCLPGCRERDKGADRTVRIELDSNPRTIDPLFASSGGEIMLVCSLFEGLTRVDSDGQVSPAAAESYTVSADGLVYTFVLRQAVWSDGKTVTAADFLFGLRRAVDPAVGSPLAGELAPVQNAAAVTAGEKPVESLGVEAPDERTLILRLERPYDAFPALLSTAAAFPCREDVFVAAEGRYGMTAKTTVTNGPFTLRRWAEGISLTLARSSRYTGPNPARSAAVVLQCGRTAAERCERLLHQESDMGLLPDPTPAEGTALRVHAAWDTTWVLVCNPAHPLAGSDEVRRALLGSARDPLPDALPAGWQAAWGLVPSDYTAGGLAYRRTVGAIAPLETAASAAKAAYAAAAQALTNKTPPMTLLVTEDELLVTAASRLAQQWQKELGAYVTVRALPEADWRQALAAGEYALALTPLSAADGTAASLMGALTADGSFLPEQSRQALREKLNAAAAAETSAVAAESLRQAEQALVDDGWVLPLAERAVCVVARPVIDRLEFGFFTHLPDLTRVGKTGD